MRPEEMLEQRRQRDQQAEEEDDREQVTHSFSPYLSTAESTKGGQVPRIMRGDGLMFLFCSQVNILM